MTGHSPENIDDELPETQGLRPDELDAMRAGATAPAAETKLGRYAIRGMLGKGGFAEVFLAHDEELDREVAVKIPRRDRFRSEQELRTFADEAKTVARLQHPGIVTVFDVGNHGNTPFIVLEFIRGRSLAHLLKHESLTWTAIAQLGADIASALAHAHEQGFVHRDIKPQNILLDTEDRPHIADFGLAMRHREVGNASDEIMGTTHYMAPEQIRGESHRIDGRTDIWALGIILYEMLTRQMPFSGTSAREVMQRVLYKDPVPPRQIDATIPAELERICLKCLARQMTERYRRITDVAADLDEWLEFVAGASGSSRKRRPTTIESPDAPVVPRGLRSFDTEDVDFFLRLLPGPRDRDGLPTVIRFWKNRLESREADETFRVGLLYGPSGCGKSSLAKAGVIPRLNSDIACLYIDATARDTESRLLRALRKKFPGLPEGDSLDDALRRLREEPELRSGRKVVMVLDQFEQWLHVWHSGPSAELVRALRQCDGGHVQCVLMVRDDFWLPVSRFMRNLEISIIEGTNAMLVDSFDLEHARRVLRELGMAYGKLPATPAEPTAAQTAFMEQATRELTEDNRLYPVRLAVFVEMVKDREWSPATLDEMGGTEGVGVAFLETSVGSRAGSSRRAHENAARQVLSALLPQTGLIQERFRSREELLRASGYASRPADFDDLLHLLDVELRLLTPRSFEEEAHDPPVSPTPTATPAVVYQLTHDFLVPSIREWLARKLRGSSQGRARLLLEEQAELWNSRPSNRYLPSLFEWVGLRMRTNRREWNDNQRRMMRAADRRILRAGAAGLSAFLALGVLAWLAYRGVERAKDASDAQRLVSKLQDVHPADLPRVIEEMAAYRTWVQAPLRATYEDRDLPEKRRMRAGVALLPLASDPAEWVAERLVQESTPPEEFLAVRNALLPFAEIVQKRWESLLDDESQSPRLRFRAACALAPLASSSRAWDSVGDEIARSLLREPSSFATIWIEALRPVTARIRVPLLNALHETTTLEAARVGALAIYSFDDDRVSPLVEVLAAAEGPRYRALMELLRRDPVESRRLLREQLESSHKSPPPSADVAESSARPPQLEQVARRKANCILGLFELGDSEPLIANAHLQADPRLRTSLVHGMNPERMDLTTLLPLISDSQGNDLAMRLALLASWRHMDEPLSHELRQRLEMRLIEIYRAHRDPEAHAAARLLLRKLGKDRLEAIDRELMSAPDSATKTWNVNRAGITMVTIDPRALGVQNWPPFDGAPLAFAIASTELTRSQLEAAFPNLQFPESTPGAPKDRPAIPIELQHATAYCNWLSQLDGLPESEWCYPPNEKFELVKCDPVPGYLSKSGYRLPLDAEWEFACRALSTTSRFCGDNPDLLRFYAWDRVTSGGELKAVGELLPNGFGLFDMYGNAQELCIQGKDLNPSPPVTQLTRRSSNNFTPASMISSQNVDAHNPRTVSNAVGLRIAKSVVRGEPN